MLIKTLCLSLTVTSAREENRISPVDIDICPSSENPTRCIDYLCRLYVTVSVSKLLCSKC